MSKFEGDPHLNKTKSEIVGPSSGIERARSKFEADAKYQNKERKWWEKMLGMKKVSKEDIAAGYAEQLEEFVTEETGGDKNKESEVLAKWHILHSPAMAGSTNRYSIDAKAFAEARDLWAQATEGKLSVDEINKWPEVQEGAKNKIQWYAEGYPFSFKSFISERDQWVKAGVLTQEEANQLPGVQKAAENDIRRTARAYPHNKEALEKSIGNWVGANVVDESTARAWV